MPLDGKIGPLPVLVKGTTVAADREEMWEKTQCSASIRGRTNRERSLTVSGPVLMLEEAHKLAMAAIQRNLKL
eukprot:1117451-Lingulodinium_polyedra.AAC.1